MIEMQKLREGQSLPEQSAVQGRLTISDIKLPLKSEFMSKIGSLQGKYVSSMILSILWHWLLYILYGLIWDIGWVDKKNI